MKFLKNIVLTLISIVLFVSCIDINYYETDPTDSITDPFITTWDVNLTAGSPAGQLTIATKPFMPSDPDQWEYNFNVDWGDGNTDSGITESITHTYDMSTGSIFTVKITGIFPQMYFEEFRDYNESLTGRHGHDINTSISDTNGTETNSTEILDGLKSKSDAKKLLTIEHWGDNRWKSMQNAFVGAKNLMNHADDAPDLSKAKSLENMFKDCQRFDKKILLGPDDSQPLQGPNSHFPAGNYPIYMHGPDIHAVLPPYDKITDLDIIRRLGYSAGRTPPTPQVHIEDWDVSTIINMSGMFDGATLFNQPLNGWESMSSTVSHVRLFSHMFRMAKDFDRDLDDWDTSSAVTMADMFMGAKEFDGAIGTWDTSKVKNMSGMFMSAEEFNDDISNWNISEVNTTSSMFANAKHFNQPIGGKYNPPSSVDAENVLNLTYTTAGWDVSGVLNMRAMFAGATRFNQPLDRWDVSKVKDMSNMFNGDWDFQKPVPYSPRQRGHFTIRNWDISDVNNTSGMFATTDYFNDNISGWNTAKVMYMNGMFQKAKKFNQPIGRWTTSEVNDTSGMFWEAEDFNQPIGSWDMSKNHNMMYMFGGAEKFNQPIGSWTTSNVLSMKAMFYKAEDFNQPIGSWDTSNVKDMGAMFLGAKKFNQPIDTWTMSSVKTTHLSDLNVSLEDINSTLNERNSSYEGERGNISVDTSSVTSIISKTTGIGFMFAGAEDFNQDLCSWDVSGITELPAVFANAKKFNGCVGAWTTSNMRSMEAAFLGAEDFNQDLTGWDVSNVENMAFMFAYAKKFNGDVSTWSTPSLADRGTASNEGCPYTSIDNSIASLLNGEGSIDLDDFKTHAPCGLMGIFYKAEKFNRSINSWFVGNIIDGYMMFSGAKKFNQPLNSWNVAKFEDMGAMFKDAKDFNQNLSSWSMLHARNMRYMFANATSFNQNVGGWNYPAVAAGGLVGMFKGASSFNQNYAALNAPTATSLQEFTLGASSFNQSLAGLNISNIVNMGGILSGTSISAPEYSATINGWQGGSHHNGVPVGAVPSCFDCSAVIARDQLSNIGIFTLDDGWGIADGGICSSWIESADTNATTDSNGNGYYNGDVMCGAWGNI